MGKWHINAARVNARMTQKEAASAVGVSESTIIEWEKEKRFPGAVELARLCDIYKCDISDIFIPR